MEYVLDGYCGVYCGACPNLLVTKNGTADEGTQCHGCKSDQPNGYCATCGMKACAQSKGFDFCIQCDGMNTCELMQTFVSDKRFPYGQCVLLNLEMIRDSGLSHWLETQDRRWRCEHCGTLHSWYHETCQQCGQVVSNYQADIRHP